MGFGHTRALSCQNVMEKGNHQRTLRRKEHAVRLGYKAREAGPLEVIKE